MSQLVRRIAIGVALVVLSSAAIAAPTACPAHFLGGQAPDLLRQGLATKARELCFSGYGNLHSGLSRTGLYSASRLTRARVLDGRDDERVDQFHEEPRLPAAERALIADYVRSGFDRGHIAPNKDFPEPASQAESFSLANIAPQVPEHNRGLWKHIEMATRELAIERGELYVVTGVKFTPDAMGQVASLKGRVLIPSHFWKAIYDPASGRAAAYLSPNDQTQTYEVVSIADLAHRVGIDPFPAMPAAAKVAAMALPDPTLQDRRRSRKTSDAGKGDAGGGDAVQAVQAAAAALMKLSN